MSANSGHIKIEEDEKLTIRTDLRGRLVVTYRCPGVRVDWPITDKAEDFRSLLGRILELSRERKAES